MVLTYFVSTIGIEDYSVDQLEKMLTSAGIIKFKYPRKYESQVRTSRDGTGNEFYSMNIIVGDDEGSYVEGGSIFGYSALNEYNSVR